MVKAQVRDGFDLQQIAEGIRRAGFRPSRLRLLQEDGQWKEIELSNP